MKNLSLVVLFLSANAFADTANRFSYTPDGYLVSIHKSDTSPAQTAAKDSAREPGTQQQEVLKTFPAEPLKSAN
jgi:hypothetical protein